MDFRGDAIPLKEGDYELVAGYLGCEVAMLKALAAIESRGDGFKNGRPVILNEYHWFWKLTSGARRQEASRRGLAFRNWDRSRYPRTQDARYEWLNQAMRIDPVAALQSCSWGIFQVMGFNYKVCGFESVEDFVRAMMYSEGAHILVMARFVVGNRLQRHLRSKNWEAFARGYNGSGFRKNGYHTKLRNEYRKRPASEKVVPRVPDDADLQALLGPAQAAPAPARPTPRTVAEDAAAPDRISTTEITAVVTGVTSVTAPATKVIEAIEETQSLAERLMAVSPWILLMVVGAGAAWWIWRERKRKRAEAAEALNA